MNRKVIVAGAVIIAGVILFSLLVIKSNPSGTPPDLRITFMGKNMFVRWSSNESTMGEVVINGETYKENNDVIFHKMVVPNYSVKHMQIKEFKNGKIVADYCVNLHEVKNSSISVGIYIGEGADSYSYRMLAEYFEDMGFSVEYLISNDFTHLNTLFKYDLIAFPGGRSDLMLKGLSIDEINNLGEYVEDGGSYMGVCAGAYFASEYVVWHGTTYQYPLDLYDGKAIGPILAIGNYNTNNPFNPQYPTNITWYDGEVFNVTYWGGPYFSPTNEVTIIAEYNKVHEPAAIKFSYGNGRVILFGFHPEIDTHYSKINREKFLEKAKIQMYWLVGM